MGKATRASGASVASGKVDRLVRLGGTDVELAGANSDLHAGGNMTVRGDMTLRGELLTGTYHGENTFTGIEREARFWSAGNILSETATVNFGNGWPRLNLPTGVTTHTYTPIEIEEWWLLSTLGCYFEWVNDHSTTGNVRWDVAFYRNDIAVQTLAAAVADPMLARSFTAAAPAANTSTTSIVSSVQEGHPLPMDRDAPFANMFMMRISRLGGDDLDTLDGPVGLVFTNMTRGQ